MVMGQNHPEPTDGPSEGLVAVLDADGERASSVAATIARLGVQTIVPDDPHRFLLGAGHAQPDVVVAAAGEIGDAALDSFVGVDLAPPVILAHGAGDIPTVVEAMRRGAFDYVAHPVDTTELRQRVLEGLEARRHRRERAERRAAAERRVASLDARLRLLAEQIMLGLSNNEIARAWGVSERTVASHRAALMRAAGAANTAHLLRILIEGGLTPPANERHDPRHSGRPC